MNASFSHHNHQTLQGHDPSQLKLTTVFPLT